MNKFTKKERAEVDKMTEFCGRVIDGGYPDEWAIIGRKIVRAYTHDDNEPHLKVLSLTALRKEYRDRRQWGDE